MGAMCKLAAAASIPLAATALGVVANEPRAREWVEVNVLHRYDPCPTVATRVLRRPKAGAHVLVAAQTSESTVMVCDNLDGTWVYYGDRDGSTVLAPAVRLPDGSFSASAGSTQWHVACGTTNRLRILENSTVTDDERFVDGCHQLIKYLSGQK